MAVGRRFEILIPVPRVEVSHAQEPPEGFRNLRFPRFIRDDLRARGMPSGEVSVQARPRSRAQRVGMIFT